MGDPPGVGAGAGDRGAGRGDGQHGPLWAVRGVALHRDQWPAQLCCGQRGQCAYCVPGWWIHHTCSSHRDAPDRPADATMWSKVSSPQPSTQPDSSPHGHLHQSTSPPPAGDPEEEQLWAEF